MSTLDAPLNETNPRPGAALPESRFSVVLVEPQYRDNVGHTARAMLNFGVGDLVLVNAPEVDEETRTRAVHAQGVLSNARRLPTLADVKREFETVVGFAARVSGLDKAHRRLGESLPEVARRLDQTAGRVALVFGREDFGLSNEDVAICDQLCRIPTSPAYRSMNLSHAVSVALYEITRSGHAPMPYVSMATPHEKGVLFATYKHLNKELGYQPHRIEQADMMFRRVIGRAGITSWEYHRLMGTMSRSLKRLGAWPPVLPAGTRVVESDESDDAGDETDNS